MKKEKALKTALWAMIFIYGIICVFLFYKQTFHVEGMPYESDLPYHISMAVEDHWLYSLTGVLYQFFFLTPFGNFLTALFLGIVAVAAIYVTYLVLREIGKKCGLSGYSEALLLFAAFLCNVAMPFYLEWAHYQRYIGYQSASIWHNSTYQCMKLFGILAFLFYLRMEEKYRNGLSKKEWALLAVLFALTSAVKPSFLMVFAPIMAIYLLVDLCHKVEFGKVFLFGLTVIPSLLVILWQNMVLFGEDTGNGIIIAYAHTMSLHGTHPKVSLVLSVAFPVFVLLFLWKELFRDKWYLFSWLVWGNGLLQYMFLAEEGARSRDGNFTWGYSFCIFLILIFSVMKVIQVAKKPKGIFEHKPVRYGFLFCAGAILIYQSYCGLYFFAELCKGATYWM